MVIFEPGSSSSSSGELKSSADIFLLGNDGDCFDTGDSFDNKSGAETGDKAFDGTATTSEVPEVFFLSWVKGMEVNCPLDFFTKTIRVLFQIFKTFLFDILSF